jgi:signal transduction histidine kinase
MCRQPALACIDPQQFDQIIMHLAIHARETMPEGGTLTLETSVVEMNEADVGNALPFKPGSHVMLAVADTGTGMDEATRTNLFEPFFAARELTRELARGRGLALASVYGTIMQSGGHIYVDSAPGHGTTFRIYLPAAGSRKPS